MPVTIHVEVTAEDIAFGRNPGETHNPYWSTPIERALGRLTGQEVSVDGEGAAGSIRSIGQGEWTLVVDLPLAVAEWLDHRWEGEIEGEPFSFELPVPSWVVALCQPRGRLR